MTNFEVKHMNNSKLVLSYFVEAETIDAALEQAKKDAQEWNSNPGVAIESMASYVVCNGQERKVHG